VIGSGVGFALATARRFGAEGWTVHLVARSREGLERLEAKLADDAHPLDAMVFQPRGADDIVDVLNATVDNVRPHLDTLVLGAVAAATPMIHMMIERSSGAMILIGGGSARAPLRFFGNVGPAMSGLRNYAMTLNTALGERGVYSGFYTVAGPIGTSGSVATGELDPDALAERVFTLVRDRDANEVLMTPEGAIPVKGSR
jgi:NAD(P)-dependent dehydrogenase (short-subunit alcohol dehydrogenase family)